MRKQSNNPTSEEHREPVADGPYPYGYVQSRQRGPVAYPVPGEDVETWVIVS